MATATLERKKFSPRDVAVLSNHSSLEDAKQFLHYTPEALKKESSRLAHHEVEKTVADVLERLEIEPLDSKTVKAYQTYKVRQAYKTQSSAFVRYMHESANYSGLAKGERVVWIMTIVMIVAVVVTAVAFAASDNNHPVPASVTQALRVYWGFFLSAYCILMYARHKNAITITGQWLERGLSYYDEAVPEFALARAVAIKKELPSADFYVEQLEVTEVSVETRKHVPDPFMVMHYGTVKLYLDVWDEPKFEGRRQI